MSDHPFWGVGWRFPLQIEKDGAGKERVALARHEAAIRESIWIILGTSRGERVMRPDFGCDIKRLIFAENNTATAGLAIFYVREALRKWEPRIVLLGVDANPAPDTQRAHLLITVDYRTIATNTVQNMVYPFYLGSRG